MNTNEEYTLTLKWKLEIYVRKVTKIKNDIEHKEVLKEEEYKHKVKRINILDEEENKCYNRELEEGP